MMHTATDEVLGKELLEIKERIEELWEHGRSDDDLDQALDLESNLSYEIDRRKARKLGVSVEQLRISGVNVGAKE